MIENLIALRNKTIKENWNNYDVSFFELSEEKIKNIYEQNNCFKIIQNEYDENLETLLAISKYQVGDFKMNIKDLKDMAQTFLLEANENLNKDAFRCSKITIDENNFVIYVFNRDVDGIDTILYFEKDVGVS